jgi:hypothetical protein
MVYEDQESHSLRVGSWRGLNWFRCDACRADSWSVVQGLHLTKTEEFELGDAADSSRNARAEDKDNIVVNEKAEEGIHKLLEDSKLNVGSTSTEVDEVGNL